MLKNPHGGGGPVGRVGHLEGTHEGITHGRAHIGTGANQDGHVRTGQRVGARNEWLHPVLHNIHISVEEGKASGGNGGINGPVQLLIGPPGTGNGEAIENIHDGKFIFVLLRLVKQMGDILLILGLGHLGIWPAVTGQGEKGIFIIIA